MPDEPREGETVYNPERDGGARRVHLERPAVTPVPDHSGRNPEGPKTAKFNPDDIPDDEMARGAAAVSGGSSSSSPNRTPGTKDKTLQRFLES